ncbi:conserved hypothetical protein [Chryseobacterium sp. 8AT]|nr:conserved hypothetical protein [Chryseobacterium sp. 8AT]
MLVAFILPKIIVTNSYRYGELHNLWAFSVLVVFAFHGISILLTVLNIAFIILRIRENKKRCYILLLTNIPIILFELWFFITI